MKHFFGERFQNSDMGERLRDLQKEVQKHQERMQQWNRGPKKDHLPALPPPHPREEGKKEDSAVQKTPTQSEVHVETHVSASANIIRLDETGEYQLKTEDGKKTFIVRPKDGTEKSWPVNTDKERQAVPEAYREKLNLFDSVKIDISTPAVGPQPPSRRRPPHRLPRPILRVMAKK
ncbi:MAG: hypothetical protein IPK32_06510 [Verrucomicrobiaceae bacterium]|nr:hypothetical protein [Verrucomicrobiaceae bacterium]